jgi:AmpD protein
MKNKYILENANYIESHNCEDRPDHSIIDSIIIHCISLPENEYNNNNVINLFTNKLDINLHDSFKELKNTKVSSHLFIKRHGELIQFVPLDKKAWHAGKSEYMNRENFNDFSIGIEMEGSVNDSYTDEQYLTLKNTINELKKLFPSIQDSNILGHNDIAPGRKTDPGKYFLWDKIK